VTLPGAPATRAARFVVFEGGEGSGKSTQCERLAETLRAAGHEVVVTREPGGTPVGTRIRELLLDPASAGLAPRAEALLYAADRAHHVATVIRPALERGAVVISDRYVDSSLAYQGAGRALPAAEVAALSRWATDGLVPGITVVLDVDPSTGLLRAGAVDSPDRLESEPLAFHERVRTGFLTLAASERDRYAIVDAALPLGVVTEQVAAAVLPVVGVVSR
jgi:dTMP kinase